MILNILALIIKVEGEANGEIEKIRFDIVIYNLTKETIIQIVHPPKP